MLNTMLNRMLDAMLSLMLNIMLNRMLNEMLNVMLNAMLLITAKHMDNRCARHQLDKRNRQLIYVVFIHPWMYVV
jgi:hypothetical protein